MSEEEEAIRLAREVVESDAVEGTAILKVVYDDPPESESV
jgi:hypothetical protein